eukprot:TRINITY_DN6935_c0_g1_i1.p1 TRINITY_DN6935_c0_g1~~TRINITY_DN6935_c0_g1_i1.p1  ORF type:complete len:175 (+),score=35.70 TRINITY_DN6935_c0_g1_i1:30-527(+)
MSTPAKRRLIIDLKKLQADPPLGIAGAPNEDNIYHWKAVIFGPQDTPWDGGTFRLSLEFPQDYPTNPPKVFFLSKIFHPNVYTETGEVCLDTLQKLWSPMYDIAAILTSVQSLLCDPNPSSPANMEAAKLFEENTPEYLKRVKESVEQSWSYIQHDCDLKKKYTP